MPGSIVKQTPLILALTWFATSLALLVSGLFVRLAPIEQSVAWPWTLPLSAAQGFTQIAALILATVSVLLILVFTSAAKEHHRARPFAELILFFPLLFAFVWYLLPAGPPGNRDFIIGGLLAIAAIFLVRNSPKLLPRPKWNPSKSPLIPDAALVLAPIVLGLFLGNSLDLKASGLSLLLYPVYAFLQLGIFLFLPVTRLRALGLSPILTTVLTSLIFAIIHWPNPVVMAATFGGMMVWAHQFQKGRPLWQLALIMGLVATTFSQFLPDDFTRHMRVGPGYVRHEAVTRLAENKDLEPSVDAQEFLSQIYPSCMGREIQANEIVTWLSLIDQSRRYAWANIFIVSSENRTRRELTQQSAPPKPEIHWTQWEPQWKKQVQDFASDEYWLSHGGNWRTYASALYQDVLNRGASAAELDSWNAKLSVGQRKRLVAALLEYRLENGTEVFQGMTIEDFKMAN
ncbi:MAG: DUF4214 domain-containing protein [bacterium]|nr:DUF4214 domain-containing protein [bacterium]